MTWVTVTGREIKVKSQQGAYTLTNTASFKWKFLSHIGHPPLRHTTQRACFFSLIQRRSIISSSTSTSSHHQPYTTQNVLIPGPNPRQHPETVHDGLHPGPNGHGPGQPVVDVRDRYRRRRPHVWRKASLCLVRGGSQEVKFVHRRRARRRGGEPGTTARARACR